MLTCFQALCMCHTGCFHHWFSSSYMCCCFFWAGLFCWLLLWTSDLTTYMHGYPEGAHSCVLLSLQGFSHQFEGKHMSPLWSVCEKQVYWLPDLLPSLLFQSAIQGRILVTSIHSGNIKTATFPFFVLGVERLSEFESCGHFSCIRRRRCLSGPRGSCAGCFSMHPYAVFSWRFA